MDKPRVIPTHGRRIQIKVSRFLIDEAVTHLKDSGETFISNIDAVQAYRCRLRIAKKIDDGVVKAYPATSDDPETNVECDGYLFRLLRT